MAAPLRCGAEGGQEQPEGGGQHEGTADGLQNAGGDQEARGRGETAHSADAV